MYGEPYIGAVPGVSGLLVAAGFHGQGFCVGPMAGKILSDRICGRETDLSLNAFRPDRFSRPVVEQEAHRVEYPGNALFDDVH